MTISCLRHLEYFGAEGREYCLQGNYFISLWRGIIYHPWQQARIPGPQFVRRPLFQKVVPVIINPGGGRIGGLESNGEIDMNPQTRIRQ
ncbi:MAG: hypothetical protein DBP00_14525 [gamma proteobacterium symbiont of Ctena orbiculata]|nr:MAG: hypothetical protein DBP00_14525 [gamma proteobacterium symbiont of Ctena orbiculata]